MAEKISLPTEFLIGTATAAYQNEGAAFDDGKGPSIWDDFAHRKGRIEDGSTGDVACDHYHRYVGDVALMKSLGHSAYRFSVSWPRIYPQGTGQPNPKGLDFYDRLVDELLRQDLTPFVTLYHWDLPLALEKLGGWTRRETAYAFGDYAETVVKHLGDRVKYFITINEPFSVLVAGYLFGVHPPGLKNYPKGFRAAHNLLLAHGIAMQQIKAARPGIKAGIANVLIPTYPLDSTDRAATARADAFLVRLFMDPIYRGSYPKELERLLHILNPSIRPTDFDTIAQPTDFLGVNYYNRRITKKSLNPILGFKQVVPQYPGVKFSSKGWEFFPQGLYDLLVRIKTDYGNPEMYITENGVALNDRVVDGCVHDPDRIEYLKTHLLSVHRAIQAGAKVKGYFVWSLMDNFDWEKGLLARFGLVYCDFSTQKRIVKESGRWLQQVCMTRQLELE
jgi:beta-glucosidase